jgi:hypothetical protein
MTSIMRTSIHGRRLGLGDQGQLVGNEKNISSKAVGATIVVAASQTSPRAVTVQLTDIDGNPVAIAVAVRLVLFLDAARVAFAATGGSTGIAASVGIVEALIAKKHFFGVTDANGTFTLSWTDTAHEVAFLGLLLPNGEWVMSDALTTA